MTHQLNKVFKWTSASDSEKVGHSLFIDWKLQENYMEWLELECRDKSFITVKNFFEFSLCNTSNDYLRRKSFCSHTLQFQSPSRRLQFVVGSKTWILMKSLKQLKIEGVSVRVGKLEFWAARRKCFFLRIDKACRPVFLKI